MTRTTLSTKLIAGVASAAIIFAAPGLGCYEALAQTVTPAAPAAATPGGAVGAVGAAGNASRVGLNPAPAPLSLGINGLAPAPIVGLPATPQAAGGRVRLGLPAARAGVVVGAAAAAPTASARAGMAPSDTDGTRNLPSGISSEPTVPAAGLVNRLGASVRRLVAEPKSIALSAGDVGRMSGGQAREAGASQMDRVLGIVGAPRSPAGAAVAGAGASAVPMGLRHAPDEPGLTPGGVSPASFRSAPASPSSPAGAPAPRGAASRLARIAGSLAWMGAGAAAVIGIQAAAVALAPAMFGVIPGAALWAVLSGVLIGPIALYSRYRMSLRDSPRLKGPKRLFDVTLGMLAGAAVVALPGIVTGAVFANPAVALPLGVIGVGTVLSMLGGESHLKSGLLAVGSTALLTASAAAFGPLTIGGVLGLMAMPALTTLAFYLGRIVDSAESGRPFSIPGSMQPIRFPLYTWVMTGVVFALLTGYAPLWVNAAFGAWMFLGNKKLFNYAFLGALAVAAFTGLQSPVTFLALAFLPERAAVWTEALLGRMLRAGAPAPSSAVPDKGDSVSLKPAAWPKYHYVVKTGVFLATLLGLGAFMGAGIVGVGSILTNTAIAAGLAFVPLFFAKKLIKVMMKAEPTDEAKDPEVFAIMKDLRDRINAERASKGQKPIPMPEIVNIPAAAMPVPNAFATGMSPFSALVGVTEVFKGMTLDPENLRAGLIRMLDKVEPQKKPFKVFRAAISGSIPGIASDAGPQAVIQALRGATREQLKDLGRRVMRGVMGHEFNHVMHRDMVLGAVAGAQASGISFASYGVLWAVGHARYLARKAIDWVRGRGNDKSGGAPSGPALKADGTRNLDGVRPEALEPVTTGLAIKTIAGLAKVFVALWAPIVAQMLQMASSRTREAHADEGGALLTEDPASLALGLGLLMSWRPGQGFALDRLRMPFIAATQHLFTVNPGEQLLETGLLESSERFKGRPVEKKDNAFLNLFITHPDTGERIEKLHDMSQAVDSKGRGGGGTRTASDGTRNLLGQAPGTRLLHDRGDGEQAEGLLAVDVDTDEGLRLPGLDVRMRPVVDVLTQEIGSSEAKNRKLGHLVAAFERHLSEGGTVRYTGLALDGQMLASLYDPAAKALYLNQMLRRANPKLQAAVLASQLQEAYDRMEGRTGGTKEAAARQVLALDAFLGGSDMRELAETIDINNPIEAQLFETQVQQLQWAAAGSAAFEQAYGELATVGQMLQRAKDQVSLLKRQAADIVDELGLVRTGLERGPDAELQRQERVLEERSRILEGSITLAQAQLGLLERETAASGGKLETPLSNGERAGRVDLSAVPVVEVRAKAPVDPKLAEPVALIRNAVATSKDPSIRALAPVAQALDRLLAAGGRVMLAPSGQDAAAYFSPVTLDLVVGAQFANIHPALVAAMMVHELTHALDYFEGRPLTRETEKNAFTNEAIFAGAFDPREVAAKLDVRNPMEQNAYQLIYHARSRYVEGNTSLESMISEAYRTLFGAHFEGLQTASQLLEETRRSRLEPLQAVHVQLVKRAELVAAAAAKGDKMRRAQHESLRRTIALTEAHLRLLERQVEQLTALSDRPEAGPIAPSKKLKNSVNSVPMRLGPKLGLAPMDGPTRSFGASRPVIAHADFGPLLMPTSQGPPHSRPPRQEARGGFLQRAWARVSGLWRVLPEESRNREFWKFVFIQALLTIGQSFHYTALPGLIAPRPEDASRLGVNRAVNWGSQAASNLATGPLVDRASAQAVLIGTHLGRAVLMLAVPALFFLIRASVFSLPLVGVVPGFIAAFLVVIALHGFLQATSMTSGTVAYNRILGKDSAYYNRANAVYNIVVSVAGVVAPLAAGAFIGALDARMATAGAGNAMAYVVYGVFLGLATAGFTLLKLPRDPVMQARRGLAKLLKDAPPQGPKVRGVSAREENGEPVLLVEIRGDPAESKGVPERFEDFAVKVVPQRRVFRELAEGFRILWSIRFLRLTFLFSGLNLLVSDSLIFTALPRYISSLLGESGGAVTGLSQLPWIGPLIDGLTSKAGAFGLYLAAGSLGLGIASGLLALRGDRVAAERSELAVSFVERLRQERPGLGADTLAKAQEAPGKAADAVLARWVQAWKADPKAQRSKEGLAEDLRAELPAALAEALETTREDAATLSSKLGLSDALAEWGARHFGKLSGSARREAKTGLDALDRAGWWTGLLYGLAALLYWPVFFSSSLWLSVGAMLLLSALQGAALVVWPGLYQRSLMTRTPHDMGKAYSALYFYMLALSVAGVLLFGWLMSVLPGAVAFRVVGGVMTAVAALGIAELFVVFPSNKR